MWHLSINFWEFVIVIFHSYRGDMIRKATQLDEDNNSLK